MKAIQTNKIAHKHTYYAYETYLEFIVVDPGIPRPLLVELFPVGYQNAKRMLVLASQVVGQIVSDRATQLLTEVTNVRHIRNVFDTQRIRPSIPTVGHTLSSLSKLKLIKIC